MGVALRDLLEGEDISIKELSGKILVVDAYNNLYQYLSSIRQRDGSLLVDSNGNVTSHLIGLFSRATNLMQRGIKLAFVFDGEVPELKHEERERRKLIKIEAEMKYKEAKKKKDIEGMRKYASRTSRLTPEMVDDAKNLVRTLGLPVIDAPSEGEAQAAYIVSKGDAFAAVSQDYDSLLYGAERVIQNLTITAKKKKANTLTYESVNPRMLFLSKSLNTLGIDKEQLIILAILIGTDYNIGGIKGIGPKKALDLVKKYGSDFDNLFKDVKWDDYFPFPWTDVFYTIKKMKVTDEYELKWRDIDEKKLFDLLVKKHDFSEERVLGVIEKLNKYKGKRQQKGLGDFFQ
ncbi:flap endonuclease-1 [Candidatus Woesearchaeota archaeon]|nr:flap endonuclease-1 [Candidatus Woesearchaeota archaeon]